MKYLKSPKDNGMNGCIFCDKFSARVECDRDNLVLWRGQRAAIVMNLFPYTNGHLMVAPYAHTGELESLDPATLEELMLLVAHGLRALRAYANPHGFNVGANLGKCAGAGVADHVHLHIVPRWDGDTNFMPVLAETRMIPEMLPDTYDKLLAALRAVADKAG
jgi:ATP adenylyltransferase